MQIQREVKECGSNKLLILCDINGGWGALLIQGKISGGSKWRIQQIYFVQIEIMKLLKRIWTMCSITPPQGGEIRRKVQTPLCRHRLR